MKGHGLIPAYQTNEIEEYLNQNFNKIIVKYQNREDVDTEL